MLSGACRRSFLIAMALRGALPSTHAGTAHGVASCRLAGLRTQSLSLRRVARWTGPPAPLLGAALFGCGAPQRSPLGTRCFASATVAPTKDEAAAAAGDSLDKDVQPVPVILDVGGMKCGGCSAAVKRILLQQPRVLGAAVNLLTETAVVQVDAPDGALAEGVASDAAGVLAAKGFPAQLRVADDSGLQATAATLVTRKQEELRET
jgi:copper chaperone CopZ